MIYDAFSDKEYLDLVRGGENTGGAEKILLPSTFNPIDEPLVVAGAKFP